MSRDLSAVPGLVDVSRETLEKLYAYEALVLKWTKAINLISPATTREAWSRHVVDSAQIFPLLEGAGNRWLDIGSGAGFPAIVLAILSEQTKPDRKFTLLESDQRKCTFLRTVARELTLAVDVVPARLEDAPPHNADVLTARALASLDRLLEAAETHLSPGGVCLFPKGKTADEEMEAARGRWAFDLVKTPSITDPEASLLKVERISRA